MIDLCKIRIHEERSANTSFLERRPHVGELRLVRDRIPSALLVSTPVGQAPTLPVQEPHATQGNEVLNWDILHLIPL